MTLSEAKKLSYGSQLEHKTEKNADGSRLRARVVGSVKIYKTRPDSIRIPAKYGLYKSFQIGQGTTDKEIDSPLEDWEVVS